MPTKTALALVVSVSMGNTKLFLNTWSCPSVCVIGFVLPQNVFLSRYLSYVEIGCQNLCLIFTLPNFFVVAHRVTVLLTALVCLHAPTTFFATQNLNYSLKMTKLLLNSTLMRMWLHQPAHWIHYLLVGNLILFVHGALPPKWIKCTQKNIVPQSVTSVSIFSNWYLIHFNTNNLKLLNESSYQSK